MARTAVALLLVSALMAGGCGGDETTGAGGTGRAMDAQLGATHVHSLAVDGQTEALLIATHDGLFELREGLERVGSLRDDLMGFDIAGSSRYVASGHPSAPEPGEPPHLGLIASSDGGESWETVSLDGQADFHSLRAQGRRIYGYNGLSGELLRSDDGGESWETIEQVGEVVDLAIDPTDPDRVIASTAQGLFSTEDGGDSWESFRGPPGLLAWTTSGIYVFDAFGKVLSGDESGIEPVGRLGELPVAVTGIGDRLYIATDSGEIVESQDGGSSWSALAAG